MMTAMTPPTRQARLSEFGAELRRRRKEAGLKSIEAAAAATENDPDVATLTRQTWYALEAGTWPNGDAYTYRHDHVLAAAAVVGWDPQEAYVLAGLKGQAPKIERMSDASLMAAIRSLPEHLRAVVQGVVEVCQRAMRADEGEP